MKVNLESTTKIIELNGVPVRVWQGKTENGIEVHAFITRIAVHNDLDASEFEKDLRECAVPRSDIESFPERMIL